MCQLHKVQICSHREARHRFRSALWPEPTGRNLQPIEPYLHVPLLAGTIPHNSIQSLCYSPTIATIAPQRAAVGLRTGNALSKMGSRESCNCGIHMLVRSPAHGCQLIERHRIKLRQLSSSMHHAYGALRAPSTNLHRLGGSEGC